MFYGRKDELEQLLELKNKKVASLVVIRGRRRIGKSSLIHQFAKDHFKNFYEFQGLSPHEGITNQEQLDNFSEQMRTKFGIPKIHFNDWNEVFSMLYSQIKTGEALILLDEISWMGFKSPDFAGKLKIAWDTMFSRNPNLIVVICGSISSWINKNILSDPNYTGRISLDIKLEELPVADCNFFWRSKKDKVSSYEKVKILAVTGGVPKYLEEIDIKKDSEENIKKLCFSREGLLFKEFESLFSEVVVSRSDIYRKILQKLTDTKLSAVEISKTLKKTQNGDITEYLLFLEQAGFIKRIFLWNLNNKQGKQSKYYISDNYLRFYLKYIEPNKSRIENDIFKFTSFENLTNWLAIMGLQFENIILQNKHRVIEKLGISYDKIINVSPYFQTKTARHKSCQIDLLIQTKFNTLYVCEIKFRRKITTDVIKEVEEKIKSLKRPKYFTTRPVLIYEGEIDESSESEINEYFDRIIHFSDFFTIR